MGSDAAPSVEYVYVAEKQKHGNLSHNDYEVFVHEQRRQFSTARKMLSMWIFICAAMFWAILPLIPLALLWGYKKGIVKGQKILEIAQDRLLSELSRT